MTEPSKIPPELVREPQARLRRARHRGGPGTAVPSWNACLTAASSNRPTLSWAPAGGSQGRPPLTAAQSQWARNSTIAAASSHARVQTTWSLSRTPENRQRAAGAPSAYPP